MRRLRRRRLGLLVVLAVALSSCAQDDGADPGQVDAASDLAGEDDGAAGDRVATAPEPSAETGGAGGAPGGTASAPDATPDASGPDPSTGASTKAGERPADTGTAPPGSPDVPVTPAGTYEYDVEAAGSFGAFPRQESTYTLTSVVDPADTSGHQRTTSTPTTDDGQTGRASQQTVAHGETELRLVHLLTPRGPGEDEGERSEFRPDPPVLLVTTTAVPGDTWSWSMASTDGDIELDAHLEVTGVETVTVGGQQVDTLVISSVLEFRGDGFEGTEDSTTWFAPDRRLTVREESTMAGSGSFNGQEFTFESAETRVLRSLTPA